MRALLAALGLALVTGGCAAAGSGSDSATDFRGAQKAVATTVEDLQSATRRADKQEICGRLLSAGLARRLATGGQDCQGRVKDVLDDTDDVDLTVKAVRISGGTATARVAVDTGDRDRIVTVGLVREGGRWRVARLPA